MDAAFPSLSAEELLEHATWIRSLAGRLVQEESAADDLAQDTILAALENPPRRGVSVRPWLARVIRNRRIAGIRRRQNRSAREADRAQAEALPSAEELVARGEAQRGLVDTVLSLGETHRTLILLRYYEGLSPMEIGRRTGRSAGTVRGQLFRAHAELRKRLERRAGTGELDWRAALMPLVRTTREVGEHAGTHTLLSGPALLIAMPTISKILASLGALAALLWYVQPENEIEPLAARSAVEATRAETGAPEGPGEQVIDSVREAGSRAPAIEREGPVAVRRGTEGPVATAIDGHLRNAETGQPFGQFLLELRRDDRVLEQFETDRDGRFESTRDYAAGTFKVDLIDHPDLDYNCLYTGSKKHPFPKPSPVQVTWKPGESLELETGPRLELRLSLVGPERVVDGLEQLHLVSRIPGGMEAMRWTTFIRWDEEGAWVRFPALGDVSLGVMGSETLRVASADGFWFAETPGPTRVGKTAVPYELFLEPCARLEVSVPWEESEPEGLRLVMSSAELSSVRLTRSAGQITDGVTVFVSEGVPADTYRVTGWADATEPTEANVVLTAGDVTRMDLSVVPPVEMLPLRLRVRSETGSFHDFVQFGAHRSDGRSFLGKPVEWETVDGEWIGTQEIPVAPGEYEIRPFICVSSVPWELDDRTVHIPGPPLDILGLDGGPVESVTLRVVDAETGEAITTARADLLPGGDPVTFNRPEPSDAGDSFHWHGVHRAELSTWRVRAPGYRPREGSWSEAETSSTGRTIEVRLKPEH